VERAPFCWIGFAVTADEVRALYGQFLSLKGVEAAGAGEDLTMNLG
jgi:hypothetical protein